MGVNPSFAAELARRPLLEYTVGGLDKDHETGRHALLATGPFRRRWIRRRLDEAESRIVRCKDEQRPR